MDKQKMEEVRQLAMSMTSHPVAFGTIEHTEKAGELLGLLWQEVLRLQCDLKDARDREEKQTLEDAAQRQALAREAHTWWTALAGATAEIEQWRRAAERCVTAWTVVRGGVWDPNGLMDEHVDALRKALGPNAEFTGPTRHDQA